MHFALFFFIRISQQKHDNPWVPCLTTQWVQCQNKSTQVLCRFQFKLEHKCQRCRFIFLAAFIAFPLLLVQRVKSRELDSDSWRHEHTERSFPLLSQQDASGRCTFSMTIQRRGGKEDWICSSRKHFSDYTELLWLTGGRVWKTIWRTWVQIYSN